MKTAQYTKQLLLIVFLAFTACWGTTQVKLSQNSQAQSAPLSTGDRVRETPWWPTKGSANRSDYVGTGVCAECHRSIAATQTLTPMAHAAATASGSDILRGHNPLTFRSGSYTFAISQTNDASAYSVQEDTESKSVPLRWAFGQGKVGQTYVFEKDGIFYESRVSFFSRLQALDLTLGHVSPPPNALEAALGRAMTVTETRLCFGCHTTASTTSNRFDSSRVFPGVTCEACHGPGERHVAAVRQNKARFALDAILNPARLSPLDSVDFCGACHRTAWDVALAGTTGVANVRFQPYRLEKSKCWGMGNARLTCTSCHDPHQQLVRDPDFYDSRCNSCHTSASLSTIDHQKTRFAHRAAICPVGKRRCVSCHMPKFELPGSHAQFTDHWIRVATAEAPYPD